MPSVLTRTIFFQRPVLRLILCEEKPAFPHLVSFRISLEPEIYNSDFYRLHVKYLVFWMGFRMHVNPVGWESARKSLLYALKTIMVEKKGIGLVTLITLKVFPKELSLPQVHWILYHKPPDKKPSNRFALKRRPPLASFVTEGK